VRAPRRWEGRTRRALQEPQGNPKAVRPEPQSGSALATCVVRRRRSSWARPPCGWARERVWQAEQPAAIEEPRPAGRGAGERPLPAGGAPVEGLPLAQRAAVVGPPPAGRGAGERPRPPPDEGLPLAQRAAVVGPPPAQRAAVVGPNPAQRALRQRFEVRLQALEGASRRANGPPAERP
jgi:hypothetical protein